MDVHDKLEILRQGQRRSSEEVRHVLLEVFGFSGLALDSVEYLEVALHILAHLQNGGNITAAVAVIGGGPDSDQRLLFEPVLEAVHDELMGTGHQFKSINVIEFSSNFAAEKPAGTAHAHLPSVLGVGGIGPHQIAEGTIMRGFHSSFEESNLIEGLDIRGKTAVNAHNFALNDGCQHQVIKNLHAVFPGIGVSVLAHILIEVAVDSRDLARFVISAQDCNVAGVLQFKAHEQLECFD